MQLGLLIPQGYFDEFDGWSPTDAWNRMVQIARLGEQAGFGSIWMGEHVVAKWDPTSPAFDGFTAMTALAALVPRVEVGFTVINSTLRRPAMTAKAASTLDVVSGGRLVLGLGAGFKENEAEWAGVEYPALGKRLETLGDHLAVIARMTRTNQTPSDDPTGFPNSPSAAGRDHIPLLVGGHGKNVTFRLAARYADEVNMDIMPHELAEYREVLHARCDEIGRDPSSILVSGGLNPCWPYSDVSFRGRQRMMTQSDLPAVMDMTVDSTARRVDEMQAWNEQGLDRLVCAAPGIVESDEALHELVAHIEAAGIDTLSAT